MKVQINKGKHQEILLSDLKLKYPLVHFGKRKFQLKIKFTKSAIYDTKIYSTDINKLYGLSFSNAPFKLEGKWKEPHKNNSFRIGWLPYKDDEITLFAYQYIDKERVVAPIGNVKVGVECIITGVIDYNMRNIRIYSDGIYYNFTFNWNCKISYILGSYFGGNDPAMRTIIYNLTVLR